MKRNLLSLVEKPFDLVVIGGGIYGACIAWEASLRGLSVALLEKNDFGGATSANSLKTIHGGFRYLQSADLIRMRESITERRILMRIAPHLVHPLSVLLPVYGHGLRGSEVFSIALILNELVSFDRNRQNDPQKFIPPGKKIAAGECLRLLPGLPPEDLTGGVLFYDAQVYNSERLVLAFIRAAFERGAHIANYAEVIGFVEQDRRIRGVKVIDRITGDAFEVRSKIVVNASGPWIGCLLGKLDNKREFADFRLIQAVNIVTRQLFANFAVGLPGENSIRPERLTSKRGSSYLFITPWRGQSIAGTVYTEHKQSPDHIQVTREEIAFLINEINRAYPPANLQEGDVSLVHAGLLPRAVGESKTSGVRLSNHYRILDHRSEGVDGLISVEGVKYTTARDVAVKVVDRVDNTLGYRSPVSKSSHTALIGGQIDSFKDFLEEAVQKRPDCLDADQVRMLIFNYGTTSKELLGNYLQSDQEGTQLSSAKALLRAQIRYAVNHEMAFRLSDVVFRRTEIGSAGFPGEEILSFASEVMAEELGWGPSETSKELEDVNLAYPRWL